MFQRVINTVLAEIKWQTYLLYLDDVVVFSFTYQEYLQRLTVLQAIRKSYLCLKAEKCRFLNPDQNFLEYVVSAAKGRSDLQRTSALAHFPTPKARTKFEAFPGHALRPTLRLYFFEDCASTDRYGEKYKAFVWREPPESI